MGKNEGEGKIAQMEREGVVEGKKNRSDGNFVTCDYFHQRERRAIYNVWH